jgi:hypothetical protein
MEVQELVTDVRHPVQMAEDAVREAMAPRAQQHRPNHDQGDIGKDREAEGDWNVQPNPQLA